MQNNKNDLTKISVPSDKNPLMKEALARINSNEEIITLWKVINVNAIDRLNMSDHGIVHFQIVANIALRISRILGKHKVNLSIVNDHGLTQNHGELVILLASLMHDLGMSISRSGHEEYSLILANSLLHQVLDFLPVSERTIVISETLHAIISHREGGHPYTKEAGIVRVADALDMSEGRARLSFEKRSIDIYNLSAAGIDSVEISEGEERPVEIIIKMNNSAGLFQVDELLKSKLKGSGIEDFVIVKAVVEGETEKKLLKEFVVK